MLKIHNENYKMKTELTKISRETKICGAQKQNTDSTVRCFFHKTKTKQKQLIKEVKCGLAVK